MPVPHSLRAHRCPPISIAIVAGYDRLKTWDTILTRLSTPAGFLSLLYLVPALFLFILLMVCFAGSAVCPAGVYALALSPMLAWLEWPWGKNVPVGMFAGPIWGKVFVLSSILVNAAVIFATAKSSRMVRGRTLRAPPCMHPARADVARHPQGPTDQSTAEAGHGRDLSGSGVALMDRVADLLRLNLGL